MAKTISKDGLKFIQEFEGLRLRAYKPHKDDVWTIGFGTTRINGKPVREGQVISRDKAEEYFREDVRVFERAVLRNVEPDLEQKQFDALVSLVYNIGERNFQRSTLLKKLNKEDFAGAAKEFPKWRLSAGKILKGLERRRKAEAKLFSECLKIEKDEEREECLIKEQSEDPIKS